METLQDEYRKDPASVMAKIAEREREIQARNEIEAAKSRPKLQSEEDETSVVGTLSGVETLSQLRLIRQALGMRTSDWPDPSDTSADSRTLSDRFQAIESSLQSLQTKESETSRKVAEYEDRLLKAETATEDVSAIRKAMNTMLERIPAKLDEALATFGQKYIGESPGTLRQHMTAEQGDIVTGHKNYPNELFGTEAKSVGRRVTTFSRDKGLEPDQGALSVSMIEEIKKVVQDTIRKSLVDSHASTSSHPSLSGSESRIASLSRLQRNQSNEAASASNSSKPSHQRIVPNPKTHAVTIMKARQRPVPVPATFEDGASHTSSENALAAGSRQKRAIRAVEESSRPSHTPAKRSKVRYDDDLNTAPMRGRVVETDANPSTTGSPGTSLKGQAANIQKMPAFDGQSSPDLVNDGRDGMLEEQVEGLRVPMDVGERGGSIEAGSGVSEGEEVVNVPSPYHAWLNGEPCPTWHTFDFPPPGTSMHDWLRSMAVPEGLCSFVQRIEVQHPDWRTDVTYRHESKGPLFCLGTEYHHRNDKSWGPGLFRKNRPRKTALEHTLDAWFSKYWKDNQCAACKTKRHCPATGNYCCYIKSSTMFMAFY